MYGHTPVPSITLLSKISLCNLDPFLCFGGGGGGGGGGRGERVKVLSHLTCSCLNLEGNSLGTNGTAKLSQLMLKQRLVSVCLYLSASFNLSCLPFLLTVLGPFLTLPS